MALIEDFESRFILGIPAMDLSHREFADLVNQMDEAGDATFVYLFTDLINHSRAHFASEEVMMARTQFPATREHRDEHRRVLGELNALREQLRSGRISLARAFVREQLPDWFALHAVTMDSALASHIKQCFQEKQANA